ncbi:MAG: type I-E CRISPR-associated protein Cse1/CasA [Chloroflexi bacterium]|nr:type I-E CRISPR-associated protein Cse1/CasA [Chloroflexota bacterium]
MNDNYNLITARWIPVIPKGRGQPVRIGLADTILDAPALRNVCAATPLETAAVYRLLLAILQAAIKDMEGTWRAMWRDKAFTQGDVEGYLRDWSHRFNLFDERRPFFQDANLNIKRESVSSLSGQIASGADATLFSHNTQGKLRLSADDAALALLSVQAFGLGGTKGSGRSFTDAPCARGMVLLVEGESLFETLMLNLFDRDLRSHRLKRQDVDRPAWEMDDPFVEDVRRPYGLLDHLTWHNRRVRLFTDEQRSDGLYVCEMMYDIGLRTSDAAKKTVRDVFNPMYHWRANTRQKVSGEGEERTHSPIHFQAEKAMWRDSAVLLDIKREHAEEADKAPAALEQVQNLAGDGILNWTQTFRLQAFGACTESGQDKTYFYRYETLPLPLSILQPADRSLIGHLAEAIGGAERAKDVLSASAFRLARLILKPSLTEKDLASKPGKEERERIVRLSDSWGVERYFWSDLEPYFHRMIQDLPDQPEHAIETWRAEVRRAARAAFIQAENYTAGDRRSLRAAAIARQWFNIGLAAAVGKASLPQPEKGDDEE